MSEVPELVLLCGPPFVGKSEYYKGYYERTHQRICPAAVFEKDPTSGLRSVILQAVDILLNGNNVVIDDENQFKESRSSYIRVIKKKVPLCKFTLVVLVPKYGIQQLCWTREFRVASLAEKCFHQKLQAVGAKKTDFQVKKWFSEDAPKKLCFSADHDRCEGWSVVEKKTGLSVDVHHKLELAGLLIQWDSVTREQSALLPRLAEVCSIWYKVNPCGRILFIADGTNIKTGVTSSAQEKAELIHSLTKLVKMLDFPVYAIHLENPSLASSFLSPPSPGLLAYLQRRHCVELTNKATMYLYSSSVHETMAEKGGLQHLKTSKVFQKPRLVKNNVMTVKCRSPELLRHLEVREPVDSALGSGDPPDPHIPLLKEVITEVLFDHQVSTDLGNGRREYLFVKDKGILTEYAELYKKNATRIGESGSKVAKLCQMSTVDPDRSPASPTCPATLRPSSTRSPRKTPSWMQTQKAVKTQASVTSESSPSDTYRHRRLSQKTVYVMTEAELVDIASMILKEAGKSLPSERLEVSHIEVVPIPADDVKLPAKAQITQHPDQPITDAATEEAIDMRDVTDLNQQVSSQPVNDVLDDLFSCGKSSTVPKKRKVKRSQKFGTSNHSPEQNTRDISFVPDTVTMVPETITSSGAPRPYSKDETAPDLSVLDEIFS